MRPPTDRAASPPSPLAGEGAGRSPAGEGRAPNRDAASSPRLKAFAKGLRASQTDHERLLWQLLRSRRLADYKFRRQVPIGPYVADFVCLSSRLIVELDGSQHAESAHDQLRDRWFADDDFRVLRIWNGDLLRNRPVVLDAIWSALQRPSSALRAPSPARGEGHGAESSQSGLPLPSAGEGGAQRRVRADQHPLETE